MPLTLLGRQNPLASSDEQLKVLMDTVGCPSFERRLEQAGLFPLHATGITILQINVGKLCNQTCRHCHVDAGPDRTEIMSDEIADLCLAALTKTEPSNMRIPCVRAAAAPPLRGGPRARAGARPGPVGDRRAARGRRRRGGG